VRTDPQISIVIYVKNGAETIARAVDSALAQTGARRELVVVDGASTDGTLEKLRSYGSSIDVLISEPDAGAFEAANKGWRAARAPVICYLMADDWLEPDAARAVVEAFGRNPEAGIVSSGGRVVEEQENGRFQTVYERRGEENPLSLETLLDIPMTGSRYWRKETLAALGGFSDRYRFAHDRDLLVRALISRVPSAVVDEILYTYRRHAGSRTLSGDRSVSRAFLDEHRVMSERWLQMANLSARDASRILAWRRQQFAEAFLLDFAAGRWSKVARALLEDPWVFPVATGLTFSRWRNARRTD